MRRIALSLLALLAFGGIANAQVVVTESPSRGDVATIVCPLTSSGAAPPAVNTQVTATCTPPSGQYVYIVGLSFDVCTNGTGSAVTNSDFTSTNLPGSPIWSFSIAATASICQHWSEPLSTPLRSLTAGTAVTVVSPVAAANNNYVPRVYAYYAP